MHRHSCRYTYTVHSTRTRARILVLVDTLGFHGRQYSEGLHGCRGVLRHEADSLYHRFAMKEGVHVHPEFDKASAS